MVQKQVFYMVDDLDGERGDDVTTVEFAYRGVRYEIDLSEKNQQRLDEALAPFREAARRAPGGGMSRPASRSRPVVDRVENQRIRIWAREQGLKISDRGRIPDNILEAYRKSH